MKKHVLVALIAFTAIMGKAQIVDNDNDLEYLPFYQQLINKQGDVQRDGNSRAVVYKQISNRGDLWNNPGSAWVFSDSAFFTYNTDAKPLVNTYLYYASSVWNNGNRSSTTYNANGTVATSLLEYWVPHLGIFRNYQQLAETYDGNNNNTLELNQLWDTVGNAWDNYFKYIKVYNGSNYLIENTTQKWNTGSSNWDNFLHAIYTRDASGNMLTIIQQDWDGGSTAWINNSKDIYTYNAGNRVTTRIEQQWNAGSSSWVNTFKYAFTYDGNNNLTLQELLVWNSGAGTWDNGDRTAYTYNAGNLRLTLLGEDWTGTAWKNSVRETYTYDGNGNRTKTESFLWDITDQNWVADDRTTYTYDGNQSRVYEFLERYNTNNLSFENYSRHYYYYQQFTVADVTTVKNDLNAGVFPNPGCDIQLQFALNQATPVSVNVYDVTGRLLITQTQTAGTGTNNLKVEAGALPAGNYFVQLINQSTYQSSVLKFVKL